ncbi:MAG: CDP-diacylglycerol--serine O-phosphatidyltransferase [Bacteroidetes bacterium]|uniref:CDP-diacylglycerol--serine O-phosphatidyltransferase n=1 Tax=Candidatus Cryptobacteroides faecavium TaxID=2840762 RepID=A0A9D9IGW7_9BACT|nr:CDP-diacylglycerol--serine O-phosphatidyltransferase [Candidatus Cryptobacteroides faecavium]
MMNIIIRNIPNSITSLNLISGIAGILCAFSGRLELSFLLMLAAALFDFFDGFAARALKAYSPMGKELDSLADSVSFGLLPAIMLHRLMVLMSGPSAIWCYVPLVIALFSVLRLAKFNVDERQSENFIGLATPASAMICGSLTFYILHEPDSFLTRWADGNVFIPVVSVLLSVLMISEIPMFSMKIKKGVSKDSPLYRQRVTFIGIIIIAVILVLTMGLNWSMTVLLSFVAYIILNLLSRPLFGK